MRLLALAFLLAACADAPEPVAAPADADALALLEAVDGDAFADAFAALDAAGYRARLTVDADPPAGATVIVAPTGDVTLDDVTGALDGTPRLRDVVVQALSSDPPYLDPAAREHYRIAVVGDTTIGDVAFRIVEAVLADPASELGVRRVRAAVTEGGLVGAIEIDRAADSMLFDEASRVTVGLAPYAGGWVPRRVVTESRTDVPLSEPRRVRAEWTVEAVGVPQGGLARE
ncbi:hypothetical protein [Rubrivirga sp. IMCC45206]|uniref:hypothetical protein n=1 Tax=Rubrivirga sp. IMCC45206 TaxID=3391614 RepID=UPI0039901C28